MSEGEEDYYEASEGEGYEGEEEERCFVDLDHQERQNYNPRNNKRSTVGQYMKEAHLSEVIHQRRGGGGEVPALVLYKVEQKAKIYPFLDLTVEKNIIFLLDKAKERLYYEHAPQIIWKLTGKIPHFLEDHSHEEAVRACFAQCIRTWRHTPEDIRKGRSNKVRKSFPPYKDWLKRICMMLGYKEDANSLESLIVPDKIADMNKIWTHFGKSNGWEKWEEGLM